MKTRFYIFSILFLSLMSCDKDIERDLNVSVQAFAEGGEMIDGTFVVKKSVPVTFKINGEPDFITVFNGESGHMYERRSRTELPEGAISSKFSCAFYTQYENNAENTFRVYLSTSYEGLTKSQAQDKLNLNAEGVWIDISEKCNIPKGRNDKTYNTVGGYSVVEVSLDEYLSSPSLTIAFLYDVTTDAIRPRWEVHDFKIVATDIEAGSTSELTASSIGFSPFYENVSEADAYKTVTNNAGGFWNLSKISSSGTQASGSIKYNGMMGIHSRSKNKDEILDRSWLISKPFSLRAYQPDSGEAIKTITESQDEYTHTYSKVGDYKVSFIFVNENFQYRQECVKHINIKVTD